MIYCGHEYTKKNAEFCISIDKENTKLKNRINKNTKVIMPVHLYGSVVDIIKIKKSH